MRCSGHGKGAAVGSDWPNVPYPYVEALDSVKRFPLPEKAIAGVMGGNALEFLKIT